MMSFDTDDAAVFFGRTAEIHQLIEKIDGLRTILSARVLQIHGESGAGKSSLFKAGVLPRLRRERQTLELPPRVPPRAAPHEGAANHPPRDARHRRHAHAVPHDISSSSAALARISPLPMP